MMTACDLGAITKPWPIQRKIAQLVTTEFFDQVLFLFIWRGPAQQLYCSGQTVAVVSLLPG